MKIKNQITHLLRMFFSVAMVTSLAACTTDPVERQGGTLPDKEGLENTYGMLRSNNSTENTVDLLLTEGSGYVSDNIYYQLTQPTPADLALEARVDGSLLDQYNKDHETKLLLLPEANYDFPKGKTLAVAQGDKSSKQALVKFLANGLAAGEYLLPVTVASANADPKIENQTLYYNITIRARQVGDHELNNGKDVFFVFYINTKDYQPLLVDDYYMVKTSEETYEEVWYHTIGNIINLRTIRLDYDTSTQRAKLNLGADMPYVLDHTTKYIRPLQDKGRKVCLCLEGGGTGLGFCNINDAQIADFVAQVKLVVDKYKLDGVNLWDRNSGYGKAGMAAVNTTSYPKLIVALRAALDKDKLLTVTDHEAPTESFHDTAATGGIEVGQYIDYAWSGYNSDEEAIQICDPWHPDVTDDDGNKLVSQHTHRPIAGLDPSKYGCINAAWYGNQAPDDYFDQAPILRWKNAQCKQSQILVYADLRTMLQDSYESTWSESFGIAENFADDGRLSEGRRGEVLNTYYFDSIELGQLPDGKNGYGKWLKDW